MPNTDTIPQLLTIEQLAERLGITVRHVRRLVAEHRVPIVKVGRLVGFDADEIARWLDSRRRPEIGAVTSNLAARDSQFLVLGRRTARRHRP